MNPKPTYIYEKTPDDLKREAKLRKEMAEIGEEYKEPELPDEFQYHQSSSSCNIEDIQAILFGGTSSRFWIYRKHILSMDYDVLKFDK